MSNKNNNNKDYNNESLRNRSKEDSNGDKDKPLAKLLVVDDDSDIVQVLKLGLVKNRFLVSAFTNLIQSLTV